MDFFKGIIGYEHIKYELLRIIDCINNHEKYEKLGVKIPKNLLLYGNPGLGKTLFANRFIEALNRNKYILRKNKPDGDFVKEINDVVSKAIENAPSVVLLDDIDKFSNNDEDHTNTDEFIVIQSLIDDCKDKDVYFIATANELDDMPQSLLRVGRFSNKIMLESPTVKDAELIIKHYLSEKNIADDIDYSEVAKILNGGSVAELESVMNEAGIYAGFNNHDKINMDDVIKALLRIIYNAPESFDDRSEIELKIAAYHEAGHALVSEVLEKNSVNLVTIANYFGGKGGVTCVTMNDNYWVDFELMENRVKCLLAGKAATELIFNKLDVGTSSDLRRAGDIVNRFYDIYHKDNFSTLSRTEYSNSTLEMHDFWVDMKLKEYYNCAKTIIFNNRDKLEILAHKLLEKGVLIDKDVREILY